MRRPNNNWRQRLSGLAYWDRSAEAYWPWLQASATQQHFIHMGGVFSAHVTGNFVLFAAALAQGVKGDDYLKIVTFPVFIAGVAIAMLIAGRTASPLSKVKRILLMMTLLLLVAATLALTGSHQLPGGPPGSDDVLITMLVVTAMAMQNSLHRFVKGPMTTVMTGTVMNATARFVSQHVLHIDADPQFWKNLYTRSLSDLT